MRLPWEVGLPYRSGAVGQVIPPFTVKLKPDTPDEPTHLSLYVRDSRRWQGLWIWLQLSNKSIWIIYTSGNHDMQVARSL